MPSQDHFVRVARSVRRDLDRGSRAFMTFDRTELTNRLRRESGQHTTRLKTAQAAPALEQALSDQGLRCQPSLQHTTTGDRIRIFRAGSLVGDLIDAVLLPSEDHDRQLAQALAKYKGSWNWKRGPDRSEPTAGDLLEEFLPRESQVKYVQSLRDPDLATT